VRALAVAAALALTLSAVTEEGRGAGRRPYQGQVVIPAQDLLGLSDPHRASSPSHRLLAAQVHAGLFRLGEARPVPVLARALPVRDRRVRIVTLVDGARFHDGQPVRAADVVASFARLGELGEGAWLSPLFAALEVRALDAGRIAITPPPNAHEDELLALLARPEAAVLRGGRPGPGRGAGPFRPASSGAGAARLEAFDGHARGRPWLDAVVVRRVEGLEGERAAFAFGEVDLGLVDGVRARRAGAARPAGVATFFAVPHPRHTGAGAAELRRAVATLASRGRLGRYVEARSLPVTSPWPEALAPSPRTVPAPRAAPRLPGLAIAYDPADGELGDLARALRDTLRPLTAGAPRVVAVPGLDARRARGARDADWDFALVRHVWAATTPAQAALELAHLLGLDRPRPAEVLARALGSWAEGVISGAAAVAILHVDEPLLVRPGLELGPATGAVPDLGSSWRPR